MKGGTRRGEDPTSKPNERTTRTEHKEEEPGPRGSKVEQGGFNEESSSRPTWNDKDGMQRARDDPRGLNVERREL